MKEKIKSNLESLFSENYNLISNFSFADFIDSITGNNPEAFDFDPSSIRNFYEEDELVALNKLKQNRELIRLYNVMKENLRIDNQIIDGFKKDILESIEIIKQKITQEKKRI